MSTVTPRLGLVKPTTLEQYALSVFTNNMDIIDSDTVMQSEWKPSWTNATLQNAWVAYAGGGGYFNGLRYRRVGDLVHIQGMIKSGAVGTAMTTTPVGFRPDATILMPVTANAVGTLGSVSWDNAGVLNYASGPAAPGFVNINIIAYAGV